MESMSSPDPRKIKTKTPVSGLIFAVGVGLLLFGLIIFAITYTSNQIIDARMRGTVLRKEFIPEREEQVVFGRGGLRAEEFDGRYLIFVEVRQRDGTLREFEVDLRNKERFDNVEVGQEFDVGPYIQPDTVE